MKSLDDLATDTRTVRGHEFPRLVRHLAQARGSFGEALALAEVSRAPSRIVDVLKAAQGAGAPTLGSPTPWGGELIPGYDQLAGAFFDSLRGRSAFFRMLGDGALARIPMRTRLVLSTASASAWVVGAGQPAPLSKLNFEGGGPFLDPVRVAALIVVSDELLAATVPGAEAAFGRELRGAVADVVDETFLATVGTGIAPVLATASPMADLRGLLDTVNLTGAGRLYWCMRPNVANLVSTLLATNGNQLFPNMTPLGGEMLGLPALVSRSVPNVGGSPATDTLMLVDASQVAADVAQIEVDMSRQTALAMDSAPGMNALIGTGASTVSLFQSNCTGLMAKVWFAAARLRTAAVAVLDGIGWS